MEYFSKKRREGYFISIYDYNDNFVDLIDNFNDLKRYTNVSLKKIFYRFRNNGVVFFNYNNARHKLYIDRKE